MPEEVKQEEPKKKGILGKLKEASEDKEEQLAILSTFVRLGILVWSGGILTLAYVDLPKALQFPEQDLDPTFMASVFTGVLATFGVQTAKKGKRWYHENVMVLRCWWYHQSRFRKIDCCSKKSSGPAQTIKVEQAPLKITTDDTYKM